MELLQNELLLIANEWNSHRIRQSAENPGGIPDVLYFLPHQNGMLASYMLGQTKACTHTYKN